MHSEPLPASAGQYDQQHARYCTRCLSSISREQQTVSFHQKTDPALAELRVERRASYPLTKRLEDL